MGQRSRPESESFFNEINGPPEEAKKLIQRGSDNHWHAKVPASGVHLGASGGTCSFLKAFGGKWAIPNVSKTSVGTSQGDQGDGDQEGDEEHEEDEEDRGDKGDEEHEGD